MLVQLEYTRYTNGPTPFCFLSKQINNHIASLKEANNLHILSLLFGSKGSPIMLRDIQHMLM